jgi:hypothetical protein
MGGTKAKPMITCADKECGYKRNVDDEAPMPLEGATTTPATGAQPAPPPP